MQRKYLVGPVSAEQAWRCWKGPRERGECKAFNARGTLDLAVAPNDTWEAISARLHGWRPDFVVLDLSFTTVPPALWQAPVPLVGLARDWDAQWHSYRQVLPCCDLVLADAPGVEVLRRAGLGHALPANLCGLPPHLLGLPADGPERNVDVLFVGSFPASARWRRLSWLGRLAAQAGRRVVLRRRIPEAEYHDLLRRSRIVFNHSGHGECNRRAFEAAAAGALLFQEADNVELPQYLDPATEYVAYTAGNLEELLDHYLAHEDQRRVCAAAAHRRVQGYGCDALWRQALQAIEGRWPLLEESCRRRREQGGGPRLPARTWQALASRDGGDPFLVRDLAEGVTRFPRQAILHYLLGMARFRETGPEGKTFAQAAREAAPHFAKAVAADPRYVLAAAARVEVFASDPRSAETTVTEARRVLALLEGGQVPDAALDALPFPPDGGLLEAEWERAAWENAGSPGAEGEAKRRLLRWRLHTLIGRLKEWEPEHAERAARERPDLPSSQGVIGRALERAGRPADALPCLARELATNPFDVAVAHHLFDLLLAAGLRNDALRLAHTRRLLHDAAPQVVPPEPWFAEAPPPADGVQAVAASAPGLPSGSRPRVSLCLIVKDEEANLPGCLESSADLADEVIVVDTGSTDGTREVASRFGAKVFDFPWCDSFAAARNESLAHATGEWIFWLDADDRLDEDNRRKLKDLFAGLRDENAAYSMKCLCLPDPTRGTATVVDHVRLFRNRPDVRWRYRVHEQILPAIRATGGEVRFAYVVIQHAGYQDPTLRRRKLDRDLRLLGLENDEHPDDPFTLFNLGSIHQELGRHAEALPLLRRSLEKSNPRDSIVRKLYALLVGCHRALDQPCEAEAACTEGLRVCPNDTELLFLDSILRKERGDLGGAEASLLRLLHEQPGAHFASLDAGLRGHKARHNLGVLYFQQGRVAEAEAQWKAAVADRPDFLQAWLGLGECCLRQGNLDGADSIARRMEEQPGGRLEATLLRARGMMARRDFADARSVLEGACVASPQAVAPRVVLSHALLQEGRDLQGAEAVLREVLRLEPGNAEARDNLDKLLRQKAAVADAALGGASPGSGPNGVGPAGHRNGMAAGGSAPQGEGKRP